MGWKIVAHSFALLFRNFADALKVSVGPFVLALLFGYLAFRVTGVTPQMIAFGLAVGRLPPEAGVVISLVAVAFLFASAWVAVAWHRFILLEEYPGILPRLNGGRVVSYAGRSILLALLMLVIIFPISAIAGQVFDLTGLGSLPLVAGLLGFGLAVLFTFLWLRIALVLPAAGVGERLTLSDAWNAGAAMSSEILQAATIVVALNMVANQILSLLPLPLIVGVIVQFVITWMTMMVGTSLLTTLYGHLIEKRPLP